MQPRALAAAWPCCCCVVIRGAAAPAEPPQRPSAGWVVSLSALSYEKTIAWGPRCEEGRTALQLRLRRNDGARLPGAQNGAEASLKNGKCWATQTGWAFPLPPSPGAGELLGAESGRGALDRRLLWGQAPSFMCDQQRSGLLRKAGEAGTGTRLATKPSTVQSSE